MDSRSFDRLARLLGGATDRRAGLKAALGALVTGGLAADAAAKGKVKEKGKRRDQRGKDIDRGNDGSGSGVDDAKKKKVCRNVGATCKKAKNCCSGYCLKAVSQGKKKGTCQCLAEGEFCSASTSCCGGLACADGRCVRVPVPTGQACGAGDACEDESAACVFYDPQARRGARDGAGKRGKDRGARESATRICLLGGGSPCSKDQVCASLACTDGVCTGPRFVPLGEGCVAGQERCADNRALCAAYAAGSGGPAGTHCVLANGEVCDVDLDCRNFDCSAGFCGRKPVNTGDACDPQRDTCRASGATCTTYADGSDPQTYCLLRNGQICTAGAQCASNECADGTCGGKVPVPSGGECDPAQDVCAAADATCTTYADLDDQQPRCLVRTGGACDVSADCVSVSCERGVCVDLQPGACDVCESGCQYTTITAAIEAGLKDITIEGSGTWYDEWEFPGGDTTLTLRSCGEAPVSIELNNRRAMIVSEGGDVTFVNIHLLGGQVINGELGGGLLVEPGGRLTLIDSVVETCHSSGEDDDGNPSEGGAVAVRYGDFEMIGGGLLRNSSNSGGAISAVGSRVRLSGVAVTGNTVGADGGAIHHLEESGDARLVIEDCDFEDNTAPNSYGGAIYGDSKLTITGSRFTRNACRDMGGAIYVMGDESTVTNTDFTGNAAEEGGAIANQAVRVQVVRGLISGNRAYAEGWDGNEYGRGGGVFNTGGISLFDVDVTANTAYGEGGGVYNGWSAQLALLGAVIQNNTSTTATAGLFNYPVNEWDPESAGTVECWPTPRPPVVCGNGTSNCFNMDEQGTCVSLDVCKVGACG